MKFSIKNLSLTFTAGCIGGLANMFAIWLFGLWGITPALGVKIAPHLSVPWFYNRLVWGGIWGFIFFVPWQKHSLPVRGLLYSLAPSLVQMLVVFPFQAHKGILGLQLGYLTPLFVLFFNVIWGLAAGFWLRFTTER